MNEMPVEMKRSTESDSDYVQPLRCEVEDRLWQIEREMKEIAYFVQSGRGKDSDIEKLGELTVQFMEVRNKIIDAIKG